MSTLSKHYSHFSSFSKLQAYSGPKKTSVKKLLGLLEKVLEKRPLLSTAIAEMGNKSLYEISQSYAERPYMAKDEERKKEFIHVFKDEVTKLLGKNIAESAARQLENHFYISTAEHHAPITHPNYVNSNVHASLYRSDLNSPTLENVIILACANISFDNYVIPRGLLFHTFSGNRRQMQQLVFFSRKVRPLPVIYHPAYKEDAINNAKKRIDEWLRTSEITTKDAEKLYFLLDKVYATKDVLAAETYSDQITITNFNLWKKLFSHLEKFAPNLIYLEQEKIVNRLLVDYHLYSQTLIHRILFDSTYHDLLEKYFDGIMGAFSLEQKAGTFLFWALPPGQKYRVQLWRKGNTLTTTDGSYSIDLNPESIKRALQNKELIPSTLLSFILLNFYYGLQLRGWVDQAMYLTEMKKGYIGMMREIGDFDSINQCIDIPTDGLSMVRPALAFLSVPNDTRIPATTLDILLYGNEKSWEIMKQNSKHITFEQAFYRSLPNLYRSIYRHDEIDENLKSLRVHDINLITGLTDKIVSCARM